MQAGYTGVPQEPNRKNHARTIAIVAIIAVVVLVLIVTITLGLFVIAHLPGGSASPTVNVTSVNWQISGCGFTSTTSDGGTYQGGSQLSESISLQYSSFLGLGSCTITSAVPTTPGFTLVNANVPITFSGSGTQTLTVTVTTPNSDYSGVLTIQVTGS